ncbi:MAG TPA: hypothetical protein ENJ79_05805 [Gammaproteobacteria bacterium]|nr:hypothetical protein [Gammaproteobacteria bacterium]
MHPVQRVRQAARLTLATSLQVTGALGLLRRRRMAGHAVILMYHRILPRKLARYDYAPNGMTVTTDLFERQMRYLAQHYRTLTLPELYERLEQGLKTGQDGRPLAAVTFDDGWHDNYVHALPRLQRHRVPATLFVATGFIDGDTDCHWLEHMKLVLAHAYQVLREQAAGAQEKALRQTLENMGLEILCRGDAVELGPLLAAHARGIAALPPDARDRHMADVQRVAELSAFPGTRYYMNWKELRELADAGICIGAHTRTHRELPEVPDEQLGDELEGAGETLRKRLGQPVMHFAYPYGKHDTRIRAAVARAGYASACSTQSGLVSRNSSPLALERINLHSAVSLNQAMFACRLLEI